MEDGRTREGTNDLRAANAATRSRPLPEVPGESETKLRSGSHRRDIRQSPWLRPCIQIAGFPATQLV